MSAASRTIQGTQGTFRPAIAFGAVALAAGLVLLLAFSQLGATKSQTAPAAGTAPVLHDRGSSSAVSGSAAAGGTGSTATPIVNGSTGFVVNPRVNGGIIVRGSNGGGILYTGIPYPAPVQDGTGGPNRLRLAQ